MKRFCITHATIVNEDELFQGSIFVENDRITRIVRGQDHAVEPSYEGEVIDATGCYLLPGIIDDHVHFREPGLTHKADIYSESRAAAAGGVTSYFDMPNTLPQTTTLEDLEAKRRIAAANSMVNYSFFFGATNGNVDLFSQLDTRTTCGIKLFMGASTGNMLVDKEDALKKIFRATPLPIMVHCEDSHIISRNMQYYKAHYGEDPAIQYHPHIRSAEACYRSTASAIRLARESGAQLHIAHLSTAHELELITPGDSLITAEACVAHLLFSEKDYDTLGSKIKCNPAIKSEKDCEALRRALTDGRIANIATDHAPHLLKEKDGNAAKAVSGMPMIQFSLVATLGLVEAGVLDIKNLVRLMCHNPAKIFRIKERGFLRQGYKADMVLVRREPWTLKPNQIISKCGWSPLEGETFAWKVEKTFCNGTLVFDSQQKDFPAIPAGEALTFERL